MDREITGQFSRCRWEFCRKGKAKTHRENSTGLEFESCRDGKVLAGAVSLRHALAAPPSRPREKVVDPEPWAKERERIPCRAGEGISKAAARFLVGVPAALREAPIIAPPRRSVQITGDQIWTIFRAYGFVQLTPEIDLQSGQFS